MRDWLQKLKETPILERLKHDKKILILLLIGVFGMVLLMVTEFLPGDGENKPQETQPENAQEVVEDRESYVAETERKLEEMISAISGAGRTKVMVTLENSEESVWATQGNRTQEKGGTQEQSKYSAEEEYVVIQSGSSEEGGLLLKIIQPKIRGVAIVCDGGDNVYVREKITSTVASVLDISTAKISIAKMASKQ